MRSFLRCCLMVCIGMMVVTPGSFATEATTAKVDMLVFQQIFLYVVDDDPTTRTRHLYFNGHAGNFRVDTDSIFTSIDPYEPIGRIYVRYVARTEIPEELAKFRSWDWDKARNGRYRAKAGEETVRPTVSVKLVFKNGVEYDRYLKGDDWPLATPPNLPIRGRIIYVSRG